MEVTGGLEREARQGAVEVVLSRGVVLPPRDVSSRLGSSFDRVEAPVAAHPAEPDRWYYARPWGRLGFAMSRSERRALIVSLEARAP